MVPFRRDEQPKEPGHGTTLRARRRPSLQLIHDEDVFGGRQEERGLALREPQPPEPSGVTGHGLDDDPRTERVTEFRRRLGSQDLVPDRLRRVHLPKVSPEEVKVP